MCRRASREGTPKQAGPAGIRREGHSMSKRTKIEPNDRNRLPLHPILCQDCVGKLGDEGWKSHVGTGQRLSQLWQTRC